jgi:hypothetical protein
MKSRQHSTKQDKDQTEQLPYILFVRRQSKSRGFFLAVANISVFGNLVELPGDL